MTPTTRTGSLPTPGAVPTASAVGWGLAVLGFGLSAVADAAWGWGGSASALYGLAGIALVLAGGLLVVTQVRLVRLHGGLGPLAGVGIALTALGALLSFVSWAVVLWTTVLAAGALLFGLPLLRRGLVPRRLARALTFAMPAAAAVAWAGAVLSESVDGGASSLSNVLADGLVATAMLALAAGLIGLGRWMTSQPQGARAGS